MYFLYPYFFILFIFIPLIFIVNKNNNISKTFSSDVFKSIVHKKISGNFSKLFFIISLTLFVVSLARPVQDNENIKVSYDSRNILFAIDSSLSMKSKDVFPNRFLFARSKYIQSISLLKNDNVSAVLFADSLYLVSLPSSDYEAVKFMAEGINLFKTDEKGGNITFLIQNSHYIYKSNYDLIILTDGSNSSDFSEAIKIAKRDRIRISIILIGSKVGSPILNLDNSLYTSGGNVVYSKLNSKVLSLCYETGGVCTLYSNGDSDINKILSLIHRSNSEKESSMYVKTYKEFFIFPLILAVIFLIFSLFSFDRLFRFFPLFLIFFLYDFNLHGYGLNDAKVLYDSGKYDKALELYNKNIKDDDRYRYNLGNIYYKNGKYNKAIDEYSKVKDKKLIQKATYNKGNSYFKKGEYSSAIDSYNKAITYGEDSKIRHNINVAKEMLKKTKKQKDEDQSKKNSKNNQSNQNKKDRKNSEDKKSSQSKNSGQKQSELNRNKRDNKPNNQNSNDIKKSNQNSNDIKKSNQSEDVNQNRDNSGQKQNKLDSNKLNNQNRKKQDIKKIDKNKKTGEKTASFNDNRDKKLDEKYKTWYNRIDSPRHIFIPIKINNIKGKY